MNKTKLALLISSLAFMTTVSNSSLAQENPVTFGVRAGANLSNFGGDAKDSKSAIRYRIGLTTDIALTNNLFLFTGLDFQTKGAKYASKSSSDVKYNPVYVQLPVTIGYKFDMGVNTKLIVNGGAYASYGIAGKIKTDPNAGKQSIFGDNGFKRLDYGAIAGVGIEIGKFAVNAGYEYGLADINRGSSTKIYNRNPYLTVGFKF